MGSKAGQETLEASRGGGQPLTALFLPGAQTPGDEEGKHPDKETEAKDQRQDQGLLRLAGAGRVPCPCLTQPASVTAGDAPVACGHPLCSELRPGQSGWGRAGCVSWPSGGRGWGKGLGPRVGRGGMAGSTPSAGALLPPGSMAQATASPPAVPSIESSAASLKPEPSLASPACAGPSVISQVRKAAGVGARMGLSLPRDPPFSSEDCRVLSCELPPRLHHQLCWHMAAPAPFLGWDLETDRSIRRAPNPSEVAAAPASSPTFPAGVRAGG